MAIDETREVRYLPRSQAAFLNSKLTLRADSRFSPLKPRTILPLMIGLLGLTLCRGRETALVLVVGRAD
jgi:hypothetical protein